MKLNSQHNEVLTNSTRESKFTINASAQAFKILSDGLYEHKISAIVRELSCNAYDAHVENGNADEPFKVVLPNNLHPYFEIEDFGIGLDDDGVREVYTSYFTSTKNESNDAIGAFGLGSKTPFSYTNNFTIRARKDGMERVYSAYLGSDGAPCVNMMYQKETEETSGVKITVPVKEWDFTKFFNEAKFILSFFSTQPIVNDPTFEVVAPGIANELNEKGIVTQKIPFSGSTLYTGHVYAVMGGVCYRLDEYWVRSAVQDTYLNDIVLGSTWSSNRATLFVKFEIGELEVAASRETLSLDEDTEKVVIERIKDKINDLKQEDQKAIDDSSHMVKALKHVIDLYNLGQLSYSIFEYKGESLRKISHRKMFEHMDVELLRDSKTYNWNKKRIKRYDTIDVEDLATAPEINAVYYRKGEKKSALIKHARAQTPNKGEGICLMFNEPLSEHQRKRIEAYIGRDIEWFNLQDLKDEEKANNPNPTKTTATTGVKLDDTTIRAVSVEYRYSQFGDRMQSGHIDLADGKEYYWASNGNGMFDIGPTFITYHFFAQCLELAGKEPENCVVVFKNKMNEKKIEKQNIPSVFDTVKEILTDNRDLLVASIAEKKLSYDSKRLMEQVRKFEPKALVDKLEELDELIHPDMFKDNLLATHLSSYLVYHIGLKYSEIENEADEYVNKYMELNRDFILEYPMLKHVDWFNFSTSSDMIEEYINLVDTSKETV